MGFGSGLDFVEASAVDAMMMSNVGKQRAPRELWASLYLIRLT